MRAAVLYGREDVRVEAVEPRPLGPGEVRIGIEAALTCGTDLKVYRRGYHARMIVPPAVFGHELAGSIVETTPEAAGWSVGDRVVVANSAPCGECRLCGAGQENLCDDLLFLNGAYAESIAVPARLVQKNLLRLKERTDFRDAALAEPLACVVLGIAEAGVAPGDRVLVIGSGPIGLMFVRLASAMGAEVDVAGRGALRLETARRLGARRTAEVGQDGDVSRVCGTSGMHEADIVIEAVGKPETWSAALSLVRKGGVVNFFGGCPSDTRVSLDTGLMHYSSLTLKASFHHTPGAIRRAIEHVESGLIQSRDFVNGEAPLSRLPELFDSMARGNNVVKTLIRVRE